MIRHKLIYYKSKGEGENDIEQDSSAANVEKQQALKIWLTDGELFFSIPKFWRIL